jgi:hypothetical protein
MAENPYQPPASDREAALPPDQGINFNDFDLERVSQATTWMKRVSSLQFTAGMLMLAFILVLAYLARHVLGTVPVLAAGLVAMVAFVVMLLMGAVWLRQSCVAFYEGIMANAESGLALGFRKLRLYLILYGVYGLLTLGKTVFAIVVGR